ncbi:MAG TPA: hypothetical protein VE909_04465, partial [Xanthobacteraceae bacterium]|nr:hypothetical protein [Xanthobacteraceae bacterium]
MKTIVALLVIGACVAAAAAPAAERFTSAKPTPLKRLKPGKDDGNAVRFSGSVQLAGQFFMAWKQENGRAVYRRITFYPDPGSAALLPHPTDEKPVAELEFTNR